MKDIKNSWKATSAIRGKTMIKVKEELRIGKKLILTLEQETPNTEYRAYSIDGIVYAPIMVYDMGSATIAVQSEQSLIGKSVEFI